MAQVIGQRRERFQEHHPEVRLGTFLPLGIAQRGKIQERLAEAEEVLRQIVDRRRIAWQRRTGRRRRFAIQGRRAAGFE
jgi:hypothetical protein